jgi:hypothetical protein
MSDSRVPASFRDPSGYLFVDEGEVHRQVNPSFRDAYELMMSSGFHADAVRQGLLIPHEELSPQHFPGRADAYKILLPEQIPFISYPYEWSFSQLQDAALLTLELQKLALEKNLCLRDASAFNVQFLRGRPIFIDSLSFEAYVEGRPWVGYQQFCRHFLAPLALMAHNHVELRRLLRANIDGIPLDVASAVLPGKTLLRFSLLTHVHLHARAQRRHGDTRKSKEKANTSRISRRGMLGLVDSLRSAVAQLTWDPAGTEWGAYYEDTNYSGRAQEHKKELVSRFLKRTTLRTVFDLGANTGLFSRLASDLGIHTVAFDVDAAAVEKNYRDCRKSEETHLLPLINDLTNPSPGLGWSGNERASFFDRGPADGAMALALVHHLAIGNNVPLPHVAKMLRRTARRLIVEFVPKSDSQVQRLLATREDIFPDYTQEGFEAAFAGDFNVLAREPVLDSDRVLYLMERREP